MRTPFLPLSPSAAASFRDSTWVPTGSQAFLASAGVSWAKRMPTSTTVNWRSAPRSKATTVGTGCDFPCASSVVILRKAVRSGTGLPPTSTITSEAASAGTARFAGPPARTLPTNTPCRSARKNAGDQHSLRPAASRGGLEERLEVRPRPGPKDLAPDDQVLGNFTGEIAGNGAGQTDCDLVDAHNFTLQVYEWPTGVAGE